MRALQGTITIQGKQSDWWNMMLVTCRGRCGRSFHKLVLVHTSLVIRELRVWFSSLIYPGWLQNQYQRENGSMKLCWAFLSSSIIRANSVFSIKKLLFLTCVACKYMCRLKVSVRCLSWLVFTSFFDMESLIVAQPYTRRSVSKSLDMFLSTLPVLRLQVCVTWPGFGCWGSKCLWRKLCIHVAVSLFLAFIFLT